jgi:hypothetical protein
MFSMFVEDARVESIDHRGACSCMTTERCRCFVIPYPDVSSGRYGLITCTPERKLGCCSFDEGEYDTLVDAQREADRLNRLALKREKL